MVTVFKDIKSVPPVSGKARQRYFYFILLVFVLDSCDSIIELEILYVYNDA